MVESSGTTTTKLVLSGDKLASIVDAQVPFLCEIWNWQGDTSVLPFKVYLFLD